MLAVTKKTEYALVAMAHLAALGNEQVASAREIAGLFGISQSLLMNVLKQLASAGYVESTRGSRGGYRLSRLPEEINLADLVTAIEGPLRQSDCILGSMGDHQCSGSAMASCPVADPVHRVQRKLRDFLKNVTLAEIAQGPALHS
ncbi:MAG: Rrf2 family transcriptional regulator [Phycisphaerae bacterium]|jgi:Rrf2 family protein